jgi:hypothetical protein
VTPASILPERARPLPQTVRVSVEPTHEREMLLELATNLQAWPARNVVFKRALERAAQDLVRIAGTL